MGDVRRPDRLCTPVSYTRDIQPILDKYCVACHCVEKPEGRIVLEGHRTPKWSVAYAQLFAAGQIKTVGNPLVGQRPGRSRCGRRFALDRFSLGGTLRCEGQRRRVLTVRTWINEDAKYGPYSMTSWSGRLHPQDPTPPCDTRVLIRRCDACHVDTRRTQPRWDGTIEGDNNGRYCGADAWPEDSRIYGASRSESLINLDFPEKSLLLLAPLSVEAGGLGWCQQTDAVSKAGRKYRPDAAGGCVREPGGPGLPTTIGIDPPGQRLLSAEHPPLRHARLPAERFLLTYMKNWGVLPPDYDVAKEGWDAERIDDLYFDHAIYPDTVDQIRRGR